MIAAGLFLVSSVLLGGVGGASHKQKSSLLGKINQVSHQECGSADQSHRAEPAQQRRASESYSRC